MRVAHLPFAYMPDPVGGTEIYVEALAHDLLTLGIESLIVAPSSNDENRAYEHNGLRIRRFRSAPHSKHILQELYGAGDPVAAAAFEQILDEECPDAVHLHAYTRAVSVKLVHAAKRRGLPVFYTYHTPTVSCQRGTLMIWGKDVCDGVLDVGRCTRCSLEGKGLPRWAAGPFGNVPRWVGRALEERGLSGGIWTALRMKELIRMRHEAFRTLIREVDIVIAQNEWAKTLLLRNEVPETKISLSRHGLPGTRDSHELIIDVARTPLRVAFLGRADVVKGGDTLIKAMRTAPNLSIELHLYGLAHSGADDEYWTLLKRLATSDARITFLPPVPHDKVVSLLRRYHVLAVPSRWLETGPLVVLEAFAAGTPVIGSALGGIAERVRHLHNGLLLDPEDVQAWADALRRCAEDRDFLARLRKGLEPPRSMLEVANEMARLYRDQLASA